MLKGLGKAALNRIVHISDLHLRHHLPGAASIPTRAQQRNARAFRSGHRAHCRPLARPARPDRRPARLPSGRAGGRRNPVASPPDLALIADLLDELTCPLAVVYGNHDHPALFHEFFGICLPTASQLPSRRVFPRRRRRGQRPLRTGSERRRFTDVLADEASPPQIHVQHYVSSVGTQRRLSAHLWRRKASRCATPSSPHGVVRLVLSGHYHRGGAFFDKVSPLSRSRPSASSPIPSGSTICPLGRRAL